MLLILALPLLSPPLLSLLLLTHPLRPMQKLLPPTRRYGVMRRFPHNTLLPQLHPTMSRGDRILDKGLVQDKHDLVLDKRDLIPDKGLVLDSDPIQEQHDLILDIRDPVQDKLLPLTVEHHFKELFV